MRKNTQEEIIESFIKTHSDKYDYSKVNYEDSTKKVCIICPKHGEFWQLPNSHINGCGCPKCRTENNKNKFKKSKDNFISDAIKVHGNKYDYSKVEYVNSNTKICIICPIHGEFYQTPHNHLTGFGCTKCGYEQSINSNRITNTEFIEKSNKIHNGKYDYSKSDYVNSHTKVTIICPTHGEFSQTPSHHLQGKGCPLCAIEKIAHKKKEEASLVFTNKSNEIHNNKYDYSQINYIDARTRICIICPTHGEFWQVPYHHLAGCGCPKCNASKLENEIRCLLTNNNIIFEEQKRFNWLGLQSLDFYLPNQKIAIECQGIQHFESVGYFGGDNALEETINRDRLKNKLCTNNGVELVYYLPLELEKYKKNDLFFTSKEDLLKYLLKI